MNMFAVPKAPHIFFQPLSGTLPIMGSVNSKDSVIHETIGVTNRISDSYYFFLLTSMKCCLL